MTSDLELKLVQKFPRLFRDYGGDMRNTCMAWGIDCGDGWYQILHRLCEKLVEHDAQCKCNPWFAQIKEKWGSLRIYINGGCPKVDDMIECAEVESETVCERCAGPSRVYSERGWFSTVCRGCRGEM